ncbi:hypothetical protein BXY75_2269 [Ulvibacter antarcticus]|uniref:Uncharacterized protein n=1 Tax=Ulvibacter antarcticus TaxID=442714 RepID=A0A3L9YLK2_9FLAO|nr:hypothetical protein BXY75_2269 [Ulvibacter antarcticus]
MNDVSSLLDTFLQNLLGFIKTLEVIRGAKQTSVSSSELNEAQRNSICIENRVN